MSVTLLRLGTVLADLLTPYVYVLTGSITYCLGVGAVVALFGLLCGFIAFMIDRHNDNRKIKRM